MDDHGRGYGFGPRCTNATHWPWFLNASPNVRHPPSLHWFVDVGCAGARDVTVADADVVTPSKVTKTVKVSGTADPMKLIVKVPAASALNVAGPAPPPSEIGGSPRTRRSAAGP